MHLLIGEAEQGHQISRHWSKSFEHVRWHIHKFWALAFVPLCVWLGGKAGGAGGGGGGQLFYLPCCTHIIEILVKHFFAYTVLCAPEVLFKNEILLKHFPKNDMHKLYPLGLCTKFNLPATGVDLLGGRLFPESKFSQHSNSKSSVSPDKGKGSLNSTGWYSGEYWFCVFNTIKIVILPLHICILKQEANLIFWILISFPQKEIITHRSHSMKTRDVCLWQMEAYCDYPHREYKFIFRCINFLIPHALRFLNEWTGV